ncbi:MAG: LysR family transcriptional regulator [Alphaproteobacteria bacterium]|nr:MAG: LysR family transcriptional regulator [Alphaproteobacteria bacterium]
MCVTLSSISAAARDLGLSPTPASARLGALERWLCARRLQRTVDAYRNLLPEAAAGQNPCGNNQHTAYKQAATERHKSKCQQNHCT